LPEIADLTADTRLDAGLTSSAMAPAFNKMTALRDLVALSEAAGGFSTLAQSEAAAIVADLSKLEADADLSAALQRQAFIERGLSFVDGPQCPLCDSPWHTEQHLREHLKTKLEKSYQAKRVQQELLKNGAAIVRSIVQIVSLLVPVHKLAAATGDAEFEQLLAGWKSDFDGMQSKLTNVEGLTSLKERLAKRWLGNPGWISCWPDDADRKNCCEAGSERDDRRANISNDGATSDQRLPGGNAKKQGCGYRTRHSSRSLQCLLQDNG
jgi:hypothetical protein